MILLDPFDFKDYTPPGNTIVLYKKSGTFDVKTIDEFMKRLVLISNYF